MAIYRPPPPRWRAAIAGGLVGILVGLIAGILLARGSGADHADAVREIKSALTRSAGTLEVVEIEYSEAVENGEITTESEYEGARAAALRARSGFQDVREPLGLLAPEATAEIDAAFDQLLAAIDDLSDEAVVAEHVQDTTRLLTEFGTP
jgi:hypothetical protein